MASLAATPVWLEFADHQYLSAEQRYAPADVAPGLRGAIEESGPTAVFLPLGLANPDHGLTHEAGLLARDALAVDGVTPAWFAYEDAGYKHLPGLMAWRISRLFRSGLWPTPAVVPVQPDMAAKRTAIACYASQIGPLVAGPPAQRAPRRQHPRAVLAPRPAADRVGGPDRRPMTSMPADAPADRTGGTRHGGPGHRGILGHRRRHRPDDGRPGGHGDRGGPPGRPSRRGGRRLPDHVAGLAPVGRRPRRPRRRRRRGPTDLGRARARSTWSSTTPASPCGGRSTV